MKAYYEAFVSWIYDKWMEVVRDSTKKYSKFHAFTLWGNTDAGQYIRMCSDRQKPTRGRPMRGETVELSLTQWTSESEQTPGEGPRVKVSACCNHKSQSVT